jgi:hypothetical protein
MAKDWIENLAQDIKKKNHEAAEDYGRAQHNAGIVSNLGMPFFAALATCLEQDVSEIRHQLQGDVTACDTIVQSLNPDDIKLTRSRFPWFDAHVTHRDADVVLDYAKGRGVTEAAAHDRKTCTFTFHVAEDDTLSIQEAFSENPTQFHQPEDLSKRIVELLFQP